MSIMWDYPNFRILISIIAKEISEKQKVRKQIVSGHSSSSSSPSELTGKCKPLLEFFQSWTFHYLEFKPGDWSLYWELFHLFGQLKIYTHPFLLTLMQTCVLIDRWWVVDRWIWMALSSMGSWVLKYALTH